MEQSLCQTLKMGIKADQAITPGMARIKKSGKFPLFLLQSFWLLFLEQRLNVETLVRDNFTQASQGFDLDLAHAFARQTDFTAHIF